MNIFEDNMQHWLNVVSNEFENHPICKDFFDIEIKLKHNFDVGLYAIHFIPIGIKHFFISLSANGTWRLVDNSDNKQRVIEEGKM